MSFPVRRIRTARANSRGTFQPTIQDFNDQIIDDDVLYIDAISRSQSECSFFGRAKSAAFQRSTVKYTNGASMSRSQLPAPFNSPRDSMAMPDELHRRHVLKSARIRSKLSSRKQGRKLDFNRGGLTNGWQEAHPANFAPASPRTGQERENPRVTISDRPVDPMNAQQMRPRPSTTGRYFDSSNGLRTSRSFVASSQRFRLRPHTASGWNACGLKIQKMTLLPKDSIE